MKSIFYHPLHDAETDGIFADCGRFFTIEGGRQLHPHDAEITSGHPYSEAPGKRKLWALTNGRRLRSLRVYFVTGIVTCVCPPVEKTLPNLTAHYDLSLGIPPRKCLPTPSLLENDLIILRKGFPKDLFPKPQ